MKFPFKSTKQEKNKLKKCCNEKCFAFLEFFRLLGLCRKLKRASMNKTWFWNSDLVFFLEVLRF